MVTTPALPIVNTQVRVLLDQLPDLRRADEEGVHEARVAMRRLREVLPLLTVTHPRAARGLRKVARRVGRNLGRLRELDVMGVQLDTLEGRVPGAAAAIAVARRQLRDSQTRRRRKVIKALEKLKLEQLHPLRPGEGRLLARVRPRASARAEHRLLREQIGAHAHDVAEAIDQAAGVYFPNRLHRLRVMVKKLRYSVEAAETMGLWQPPRLLRDLRRLQARLGTLHDLQVLEKAVERLGDAAPRTEMELLHAVIVSDRMREYGEYLSRVDRLRAICQACRRFASRPAPIERRRWPGVAAIIGGHVGAALLAEHLQSRASSADRACGRVLGAAG